MYLLSQQKTKEMGQNVLTCQFVAGLHPDIKEKIVETEGNSETLLTKGRFEEVKKREVRDREIIVVHSTDLN